MELQAQLSALLPLMHCEAEGIERWVRLALLALQLLLGASMCAVSCTLLGRLRGYSGQTLVEKTRRQGQGPAQQILSRGGVKRRCGAGGVVLGQ